MACFINYGLFNEVFEILPAEQYFITNLFDNHLDLHFTDFIAIMSDNICRIFQRTTFARFLPFRSRTRAKYQTNQIQMKKFHFQNFKNETKNI